MANFDPNSDEYSSPEIRYNSLKAFFDKHPQKFLERVGKGPPCEYRWLAWKVISGVNKSCIPGLYKELLEEADKYDENQHDKLRQINLDLNRTFPDHPFFSDKKYGSIGQEKLKKALRAYAMYNKDVGYTQSINFLMGFFLMVNGGNDEEAFWLFVAITKKNQNFGMTGNFEGGLEGFYSDNFPLYHQFVYQFDKLFERKLPKLKGHFDTIGYPAPVWLQKWFMTLFLYSFPLKLCIRLWDNLLVEDLVLIFKFPLAIMEILEPVLLKANFEEVNDVLSNLCTSDDPDIDANKAVLPGTEKIITKARKIKLDTQELRVLKEEYEVMQINYQNHQIKMLPQIMEEDNIYEEVDKINSQRAISAPDDDIDDSLDFKRNSKDQGLYGQRPNSANFNTGYLDAGMNSQNRSFAQYNNAGSLLYRPASHTIFVPVKSKKSANGINNFSENSFHIQSSDRLPPIFNNKDQKNINEKILKDLNIETSFDLGNKSKDKSLLPRGSLHRPHKSVKHIKQPPVIFRKQSLEPQNRNRSFLRLPTNGSFAQSLGKYSSMHYIQHAHTDRDIIEEINEEHYESLDHFLLNNKYNRE